MKLNLTLPSGKIILAMAILMALSNLSKAQKLGVFYEGSITTNDGEQINCFIKEDSYRNYFREVTYRLSEGDQPLKATPHDLKGFEVKDLGIRYVTESIQHAVSLNNGELVTQTGPVFLKHLEQGRVNLFEFWNKDLRNNILYVQLENGPLKRLEITRTSLEAPSTQVDTFFSSKSIRGTGLKKTQKHYIAVLGGLTNGCGISIDQNLLLEKRQIASTVRAANLNCSDSSVDVKSNFLTKGSKRLSVGGLFISIPNEKHYALVSIDFERGFSPSNSATLNVGVKVGLPYETEEGVEAATGLNILLGGKFYFSPGSRLKPFGHVGLNYIGNFDVKGFSEGTLMSYGGGLFYQSKHKVFGFAQFSNFIGEKLIDSLDFQLGVGISF